MAVGFACALVVGAAFLYLPGYLLLRALSFARTAALACAPLIALFAYPVIAIVYEAAGVFSSWASVFLPVVAVAVVVWGVARWRRGPRVEAGRTLSMARLSKAGASSLPAWADGATVGLYVAVALAVGLFVFVLQLSSPDAIFQWFDNVHHLSQVRTYLDSGRWSPLDSSMYKSPGEEALNPYGPGTFYPSTWHCVCAMMAGAAACSVPVATNAAVVLFSCVVFPTSAFFFVRMLFVHRFAVVVTGAFCAVVCGVFPWGFAVAGPIYPNLAAMAVVPAMAGLFTAVFRHGERGGVRAVCAAVFVVGLLGSVLAHPNAAFSLAVILIPYCICQMPRIAKHLPLRLEGARLRAAKAVLVALFLAAACAVWWTFYNLPALQSVIDYNWPAFKSVFWAVIDSLTANYRETSPNYLFAACVVVGAVAIVRRRSCSAWIVGSFAFAALIYIVAASTEGELKRLLAGFWYTDFYRLGATAFVASLPVAAAGLARIAAAAASFARHRVWVRADARSRARAGRLVPMAQAMSERRDDARRSARAPRIAFACTLVACLALWCVPWRFYLAPFVPSGQVSSQLGIVASRVAGQYTYESPAIYSEREREFVQQVVELIGPDARVINEPNDGTMFAYGADGLNVMFRYLYGAGTDYGAAAIRLRLDRIADNSVVRDAVRESGAEYVIQLDHGRTSGSGYYMFSYEPSEWEGIDAITDYTPGFEVVLSEWDMRLYRITALDEG